MSEQRLSGLQRHEAIVKAAMPLFAKKGFATTTTKELAEAAGVSEALIYKHFPSKESLYTEIQKSNCQGIDDGLEKLASLEPSTSTLVHIVYYMLRMIAMGRNSDPINWETRLRLVLNSCLEDGTFARILFQNRFNCCFATIEACLDAAEKAGDMVKTPVSKENRVRFAHHIASMTAIMHLPEKAVIDYQASREEVLHQAIWFVLRGMGLKEEAIAKHYNPKALSIFLALNNN